MVKGIKALLIAILATVSIMNMWGAKANSAPMSFTQPDGTTITIILHGDEHLSFFTSEDGVILMREGKAFYVAEFNGSELTSTQILAHNIAERNTAEITAISKQNHKEIFAYLDAKHESSIRKISLENRNPPYFAHMGSPKALVVLAEYSDLPFTIEDPQKTFEQFFNAEGEGNHENYGHEENRNYMSVREYFKTCSRGLFTPEFVVTEPVKVDNMDTYGGKSETSASDENTTQLVIDALTALGGKYNLKDFDNDGDGRMDLVYIVYSGYGQNNHGPANSVWAKTSSISTKVNGVQLTWYSCASELNLYEEYYTKRSLEPWVDGIGVTCHEIGHALGLPDIYPTSAAAHIDNQEMEYWDIMDGGEYISSGYYPKDYTAWEREVMGWDSIEPIDEEVADIALAPLLEGGKAYKFCNPADTEEYFVMENIQNNGLNKKVPGHGMIVYHVKYPSSSVSMASCPNNVPGKPGMGIVPADGFLPSAYISSNSEVYRESHKGDPFPGTSAIHELNYDMNLPNYTWYKGDEAVQDILINISEDNETGEITLTYYKDKDVLATGICMSKEINTTPLYDLQGRRVSNPAHGIYVQNGKKVIK